MKHTLLESARGHLSRYQWLMRPTVAAGLKGSRSFVIASLVAKSLVVVPSISWAGEAAGENRSCYYVVRLIDGAMWVPCEFGVRVRTDPVPVLELSSPSVHLKPPDLVKDPRYRAVIYVGQKNIADTQLGQETVAHLGKPKTLTLGRVKITTWPNPHGPFQPKRFVSLLTHGDAGVLVISATQELVEQLAKSIHQNDQPITPELP